MLFIDFQGILGDPGEPGATSRDDAIFSGERYFWSWAPFRTKRVQEVSKSVPLIGQKNIFLANQRDGFRHFWNSLGKKKCPGALQPLK